MRLNHAKHKRDIAAQYCEQCEHAHKSAGTAPGCIAGIIPSDVRERLLDEAKRAIAAGYRHSKTAYPFAEVANTRDIFECAVCRLFMERGKTNGLWPS